MSVANVVSEINLAPDVATDFKTTGIKADVIAEATSATGVTIDGVLLKDNSLTTPTSGTINTGTSGHINLGAGGNLVITTDAGKVQFGTGTDISIQWNGTTFNLAPTTGMWADCPLVGYANGHALAYEFFDDFTSLNVGAATSVWTLGTNTNGTVALGEAVTANTPGAGGYATFSVDGTAQYDYATLKATSTAAGTMCRVVENSGQKLWFECNITVGTITDCYFMVGLMAPDADDITVDATGAEDVADGFYFRTLLATETQLDTATNQNTTETEIGGNIGTIAANGNYTFGIHFDGATTLTFYLDGTALTDTVTIGDTGNIPNDVGLTPVFHAKDGTSGGTADDLIHLDWVKLVQLR